MRLPTSFARYQPTFDSIEKAIQANQNLIWGVSVSSGILAGWATYASRKHHQRRIEQKITSVTERFDELEEQASKKLFWRVTVPSCLACTLIGYGIGRGYGSYRSYKYYDNYRNTLYQQMTKQMQALQNQNMLNKQKIDEYLRQSLQIPKNNIN